MTYYFYRVRVNAINFYRKRTYTMNNILIRNLELEVADLPFIYP